MIDIARLYKEQGRLYLRSQDLCRQEVASRTLPFIDGEKGILMYRGYPVEQLAANSSFIEVSYLLLHGELPTETQLADFDNNDSACHTMLNEGTLNFFKGFRYDAHPMAMLSAVVGSMSAYYHDEMDASNIGTPQYLSRTAYSRNYHRLLRPHTS